MALNATTAPKNSGGNREYQRLEAGNYLARIVQVIDLGLQTQRPYKGQAKPPAHEIMVTYELGTEFLKDEEGNDTDKPRWISETFTLRHIEQDLAKSTKRIRSIDPSMKAGGDFSQMIGMPCTVTVVHDANKNDPSKVYTNVGNVTPPMKGIPVPELVNPPKVLDLDNPDMEIFGSLPEWLQEKVKGNLEFNGSALMKALGGTPETLEGEGSEEDEEDSPY